MGFVVILRISLGLCLHLSVMLLQWMPQCDLSYFPVGLKSLFCGDCAVSISSEGLSQAFGYCSLHITLLLGKDGFPFWVCNWWALIPLPVQSFWKSFCLMVHGEKEQGNGAHRRRDTKQSGWLGEGELQFVDQPDWCCFSTKLIHVWQVSALEIKLFEGNDKFSMMAVPGGAWLGSGRGVWWCTNTQCLWVGWPCHPRLSLCQLSCLVEKATGWLLFLVLEGISNKCNFPDPSSGAVRPEWGLWVFGHCLRWQPQGLTAVGPGIAAQGAFS